MNLVAGNRVVLLKNGGEFFPALHRALNDAQRSIQMETYIFHDDDAGRQIAACLVGAARRGVQVRVLVDGFGSRLTPPVFFKRLHNAGVQVAIFRPQPPGLRAFRKAQLRRVHRKIALIDDRIGFVGGINLIDDMTDSLSTTHPRYDYAVQIEGPLLPSLFVVVNRLWRLTRFWRERRIERMPAPTPPEPLPDGMRAGLILRDNIGHRRDIEAFYLERLGAAQHSVLIVNSYFLPGQRMRYALIKAAERGVKITLLLQGRADHALLQWATRAMYERLQRAGVVIFEYWPAMLHAKVAVFDDEWSTVGSSNLDPFSLFLNREVNLVVQDSGFAARLSSSVFDEINANATHLDAKAWQNRSWQDRARSWLAFGFARWVVGLMGVRNEFDQ